MSTDPFFSSAPPRLVTLFGGSGFVGKNLVPLLIENGWHVRVASRRPPLQTLPSISYVRANICDRQSVITALEGASAVVNLVGILSPSVGQSFDAVLHQGPALIAEIAKTQNIKNFIHISAIGADRHAPSAYAIAKALGEEAVLSFIEEAVILRPSIIFGREDDFFNRFAQMSKISPALPLIGGGKTLFDPVYVGDIALAIQKALEGKARARVIYELGGPTTYSFKDLLKYIGALLEKKRILVSLPFPLAKIVAFAIENISYLLQGLFPKVLLITRDQVELLKRNNVVSEIAKKEGRTLSALGIKSQNLESIVPSYLMPQRARNLKSN